MAGYVVVLDANVLYGIEVTDLFATMAARRLFRPHWSPQILDEVVRNLARRRRPPRTTDAIINALERHLPDAMKTLRRDDPRRPEPVRDAPVQSTFGLT